MQTCRTARNGCPLTYRTRKLYGFMNFRETCKITTVWRTLETLAVSGMVRSRSPALGGSLKITDVDAIHVRVGGPEHRPF